MCGIWHLRRSMFCLCRVDFHLPARFPCETAKGPGAAGAFLCSVSKPQWLWTWSQSSRFGSCSKVCSGGGLGSVHSSVSAYSFQ